MIINIEDAESFRRLQQELDNPNISLARVIEMRTLAQKQLRRLAKTPNLKRAIVRWRRIYQQADRLYRIAVAAKSESPVKGGGLPVYNNPETLRLLDLLYNLEAPPRPQPTTLPRKPDAAPPYQSNQPGAPRFGDPETIALLEELYAQTD